MQIRIDEDDVDIPTGAPALLEVSQEDNKSHPTAPLQPQYPLIEINEEEFHGLIVENQFNILSIVMYPHGYHKELFFLDEGFVTSLVYAVYCGYSEICNILLENGAGSEFPLLEIAIRRRHAETALVLINAGADPQDLMNSLIKTKEYGEVRFLLQVSKIEFKSYWLYEILRDRAYDEALLLLQQGVNIDSKNSEGGYTALHWAAHFSDTAAASFFIGEGANVNIQDDYGKTALHRLSHNPVIFKLLLNAGADIFIPDQYGETSLMERIMDAHTDIDIRRMLWQETIAQNHDRISYQLIFAEKMEEVAKKMSQENPFHGYSNKNARELRYCFTESNNTLSTTSDDKRLIQYLSLSAKKLFFISSVKIEKTYTTRLRFQGKQMLFNEEQKISFKINKEAVAPFNADELIAAIECISEIYSGDNVKYLFSHGNDHVQDPIFKLQEGETVDNPYRIIGITIRDFISNKLFLQNIHTSTSSLHDKIPRLTLSIKEQFAHFAKALTKALNSYLPLLTATYTRDVAAGLVTINMDIQPNFNRLDVYGKTGLIATLHKRFHRIFLESDYLAYLLVDSNDGAIQRNLWGFISLNPLYRALNEMIVKPIIKDRKLYFAQIHSGEQQQLLRAKIDKLDGLLQKFADIIRDIYLQAKTYNHKVLLQRFYECIDVYSKNLEGNNPEQGSYRQQFFQAVQTFFDSELSLAATLTKNIKIIAEDFHCSLDTSSSSQTSAAQINQVIQNQFK